MTIFRLGLVFCAIVGSAFGAAPTVTLRAGAARADITPETEVLNWVTGKPYGKVLDPLSVHALVLDDGATKAVLLRWDLVDVSESARDEVRQAVGTALGMPGENIMVTASHNHSAPWAPVYREGYRGKERDTWWAIRYMPAQNQFPPYKRWMSRLIAGCVEAARRAREGARPVSMEIGRIAADDFLHNRRPRVPAWGLADPKPSAGIQYNHPDWNPEVLQGGARFGPMDRTLALVSFRDAGNKAVASLFHLACHAVSIYPSNPAISADWPGPASQALSAALGGEALFLQGCCGDINPWRRGEPAVAQMAEGLAAKAQIASRYAAKLMAAPLQVAAATVNLPLTAEARKRIGNMVVPAEIQVIVCGPLAIVGLPGEPMTELGMLIRDKSPFPQTLVLGYTNGNGAHYVGMPGEKARGGYEAGVAGAGTDECAMLMVDTALRVLNDVFNRPGYGRR
jgi:neutral ceramidase